MNVDLIKTRVTAFLYELGIALALSVLAFFSSDTFQGIVQSHFGESTVGMLVLLTANGAVKHLRNLKVLKKHAELGGTTDTAPVLI